MIEPRYEGDNLEENPLVGLSENETQHAMEEAAGMAATAVTFRVDVIHHGQVTPGQEITVMQAGGVIDGVTYEVEVEVRLAVEESYLLFATDSFDGASFAILGGSAGTYVSSGDGVFRRPIPGPLEPSSSPAQR